MFLTPDALSALSDCLEYLGTFLLGCVSESTFVTLVPASIVFLSCFGVVKYSTQLNTELPIISYLFNPEKKINELAWTSLDFRAL